MGSDDEFERIVKDLDFFSSSIDMPSVSSEAVSKIIISLKELRDLLLKIEEYDIQEHLTKSVLESLSSLNEDCMYAIDVIQQYLKE